MQRSWFPLVYWPAALGLALALWFSLEHLHQLPQQSDALRVDQVERLVAHASTPAELPERGWQAVSLPEDWLHQGLSGTEVWYRATIDLNVPPNRLWAVLLPGVNLAGAVYFKRGARRRQ